MEKCLPAAKPDSCSETTWDEIESSFFGSQCRRQPNALPPHYLTVEGHESCLQSHQVEISPIFYEQIFCTKVFCTAFMFLQFGFVIFWRKDLGAKAAYKMLVKLTPSANIFFITCYGTK